MSQKYMTTSYAVASILKYCFGNNSTLVRKYWKEIKTKDLDPAKIQKKYLGWCRGVECKGKKGTYRLNDKYMMKVLVSRVGSRYDFELMRLAHEMYPAKGVAEYFLGIPYSEDEDEEVKVEHEMPHNAVKTTAHDSLFPGGLRKNFNINAIMTFEEFNNCLEMSDYLKKGGYKFAVVNGIDLSKKTKGEEYVAEIGLQDPFGKYCEGVIRVVWNNGSYVGRIYKKFEPKCRINWDKFKKSLA